MSELSRSLQCIWTAVSRVRHLKNAKESTGARVWHPLERFHSFLFFFPAGATLKFITEVVLTNHTSTKGEVIEGVLPVVTVT